MHRRSTTHEAGKRVWGRIRQSKPFLAGSLTRTKNRGGHSTGRWVQEGPLHEATRLTWKEAHNTRTLAIPRARRAEVAPWVNGRKRLKELIQQLSQAQRACLLSRNRRSTR